MNVCEALTRTARWRPDHPALIFHDQTITYQQIELLSQAAAEHLQDAGLKSGQRVALMLPNAPAFVVWYYAVLRLGAIAVSVSTRLTPGEVGYVVSDCTATGVIALGETLRQIDDQLPDSVSIKVATSLQGDEVAGQAMATDASSCQGWFDAQPDDAALICTPRGRRDLPKGPRCRIATSGQMFAPLIIFATCNRMIACCWRSPCFTVLGRMPC